MTNLLKLSKRARSPDQERSKAAISTVIPTVKSPGLTAAVLKGLWVVTVLVWPILKWVISLDCALQLVRMIYHWETLGVYAGWDFLLHFAALAALACLLCFALQAKRHLIFSR